MMHARYGGDPDSVDQLEDVHGEQHLGADHQYIAQSDHRARRERCVEGAISEGDIYKRVDADYKDEELGGSGDVVVEKTTSVTIIEGGIFLPVEPPKDE